MNIVFLGTPEFAVPILAAILNTTHRVSAVISQPDRETDKKGNLKPTPIKSLALSAGIDILQYEKVSVEGLDAVRRLSPDIMVTAAFGQILSAEFLAIAPVYNVHASLLPLYRGSSPIQAAILNGDSKTGVTVMRTVLEMDAGDIVRQESLTIGEGEPFYTLHDRLADLGARMVVETLDILACGEIKSVPQTQENATYTKKIIKSDGHIDWRDAAEIVARKIRAYNPWPACFTEYEGDNLKIYAAKVKNTGTMTRIVPEMNPGTILFANEKAGFCVQCGSGVLEVLSVQAPGKRVLSAAEFLRGYKLKAGHCLT